MISKKINRKLLLSELKNSIPMIMTWSDERYQDSIILKYNEYKIDYPEIMEMMDNFLRDFDGESIPDVQRNINYALTVSKHLLTYHKQDLIWFQKALAKVKNVRSAFKN